MATITGTSGNDILNGTANDPANGTGVLGDDVINGLDGNDRIDGRGGADVIDAGEGADTISVNTFGPVVRTEQSSYDGGDGIDTLDLSALSQPLTVTLSTTVSISNGSNISINALDFETLLLGSGSDTVRGNGFNGRPTVTDIFLGGGDDNYDGGGGSSMVDRPVFVIAHGGAGNDKLASRASIYGDEGEDVLSPQAGLFGPLNHSDASVAAAARFHASEYTGPTAPITDDLPVIDGGTGLDTLILSAGHSVDLTAGTLASGGIVFSHLASIERVLVSGDTNIETNIIGNAGDNVILNANLSTVGSRDVGFYGGDGDDTLDSGAAGGIVDGGAGNDLIFAARPVGSLFATVIGGDGADTVNFSFAFADATVTSRADYTEVSLNPTASTIAVYHLSGVETYTFSDRTIALADGNPLVDDLYYLGRYADVARGGLDADAHYDQYGWHEGRDPDAYFSTTGYLAANADVRADKGNPLQHFDQHGWQEGRDPSAAFDSMLYLIHNPDVAANGLDPLAHYLEYGRSEGRDIYAAIGKTISADGFDAEYYLLSNADVAAAAIVNAGDAFTFALDHYETYGWREGRDPNALFDTSAYLAANADVAAAGLDPLDHYERYGWREGRDPSAAFDTRAYLSHEADVAAAGINPLTHYLEHGAYEQRPTYGDGFINI